MVFLVQMRQSNECGSVSNDEIFNLHLYLVQTLESASPASCKTQAIIIDSIPQTINHEKSNESRNEIQLPANCIILSCPNCMLFNISKQTFLKLPSQIMPLSGVRSGVVTPKYKTKSNPLAGQKVRILSKSLVSFQFFLASLREGSFHSQRATNIKAWK